MPFKTDLKELDFTYIGEQAKLEGEFIFESTTKVGGKILGEITVGADNGATLIIDRQGVIDGNVVCADVEIYGTFRGKLFSKGVVTVFPSGHVSGEIKANHFSIHSGATINIDGITTGDELNTL